MRLSEIQAPYVEAKRKYETTRDNIRRRITQRKAQIERLEKRLDKQHSPSWIDSLIRPIAEELIKEYPDRYYEILGPFGLGAHTAIHFYRKGVTRETMLVGDNCKSITFEPGDLSKGDLRLVDYSVNTHRYAPGTIAELNDMNHPTVPISPDSEVSELKKWLERERKG